MLDAVHQVLSPVPQVDAAHMQLYANAQPPENSSVTYLGIYFDTTSNTFGYFTYGNLDFTWSVSSIVHPSPEAFT
ncbi:hypothetical protein FRB94_007937, partial [Tulasnella sp. JGI-2019a]